MTIKHLISGIFLVSLAALWSCESLEKGQCKRDSHCKNMGKGIWVCYKEPPGAEIGKCMTVKDAKVALETYKRKKSGKCEDKDGDGIPGGDACDPPVDCDDSDPKVKPGASELCDAKDNDCDGLINENLSRCSGTVLGGKKDPVAQFMTTMTSGVEAAPNGEVWVTDQHNLYRLNKDGKAERVAGGSKPGNDNKKGTKAKFDEPRGMAVTMAGVVYIADCQNNCVRKMDTDGQVSSYAGLCSAETSDTGLDKDGSAESARFWCPIDVTLDKDGSLLVADMLNSKIKRVSKDRKVATVAGVGGKEDEEGYTVFGHADGPALKAEFNQPAGIAVGKDGGVYIADAKNNCIRLLKGGKVSTLAGRCKSGKEGGAHADGPAARARFNQPNSLDVADDGTVWVADTGNHCIRKIQGGKVSTVSGKPKQPGYYDGPVDEALFNQPQTISLAKDGSLYVVDLGNYRVRQLKP
jgi:sugar lactone lactonase YvrE